MDSAGMRDICAKLPLAEAALEVFRFVGDETRLQSIFDKYRGANTYEDKIRFPTLVDLVGAALLEHGGSGNQSFSRLGKRGWEYECLQGGGLWKTGPASDSLEPSLSRGTDPLVTTTISGTSPAAISCQLAELAHDYHGWQSDQECGQAIEALPQSGRRPPGRPDTCGHGIRNRLGNRHARRRVWRCERCPLRP